MVLMLWHSSSSQHIRKRKLNVLSELVVCLFVPTVSQIISAWLHSDHCIQFTLIIVICLCRQREKISVYPAFDTLYKLSFANGWDIKIHLNMKYSIRIIMRDFCKWNILGGFKHVLLRCLVIEEWCVLYFSHFHHQWIDICSLHAANTIAFTVDSTVPTVYYWYNNSYSWFNCYYTIYAMIESMNILLCIDGKFWIWYFLIYNVVYALFCLIFLGFILCLFYGK